MPSRPPETDFYNDAENALLWRDLSRLYEDFVNGDESRKAGFERVVGDIVLLLSPLPCQRCQTPVVNIAPDSGTDLQCPKCGWKPVEVVEMTLA